MDEKFLYTPLEVAQLLQSGDTDILLVDIRDREAYKLGHIPGAVHIPEVFEFLSFSTPAGLADLHDTFQRLFRQAGVEERRRVIFYEENMDSRYGASCRGYWLLTYLGHDHAGILEGGMLAWEFGGLAVQTTSVAPLPGDFTVRCRPAMIATRDDVLKIIDAPQVILLDNRDADEWFGRSSSPYGVDFAPRRGRIPGARWIEWYRFMDRSQAIAPFISTNDILDLCGRQGIFPDSDVIIYCFKGSRAAHTYVALKLAGFTRLRIYFASWNEWARDPILPIEV